MEIGSEFSTHSSIKGKNEYFEISSYPKRFFLSGRTGLYFIGQELKDTVEEILLPQYCCGSMVAPFWQQGYKIAFYDSFDLNNVAVDGTDQAVLIMDYFGFLSNQTLKFISRCKAAGKTVIIDATQTAFSYSKCYEEADYIVVSYRKWFDCICAAVYSKNGFSSCELEKEDMLYTPLWRSAAELKERYLQSYSVNKQEFLDLYAQANHQLEVDFLGYKPIDKEVEELKNVDSAFIREKRRNNATFLMEEVKKLSLSMDVQLIYDDIENEDCPLFVPILVNGNKRSLIRRELINNDVYCSIHWPIDSRYPYCVSQYHNREISLICDQRYGIEEMKKQITVLSQALILSVD